MAEEATSQNQYLYQVAQHMKETSDRLEKKLDANTELTQSVLIQATKTNGRVNGLEGFSEDSKKAIEELLKSNESNRDEIALIKQSHKSDVSLVVKLVSVATFFVGALIYLGWQNLKNSSEKIVRDQTESTINLTAEKVVSTLEQKYNLKIEN